MSCAPTSSHHQSHTLSLPPYSLMYSLVLVSLMVPIHFAILLNLSHLRAFTSHPTLGHTLSPSRSRPHPAPFSYTRTHHRASSCAPGAPRDRAPHAPAAREYPRSLLARLCPTQCSHVGGRANRFGPGMRWAVRRGGNCPASGHAWTREESGKGLGRMDRGRSMFTDRARQPERYFRRQQRQARMGRGEPSDGAGSSRNDVF
jgi:hypothetical protein